MDETHCRMALVPTGVVPGNVEYSVAFDRVGLVTVRLGSANLTIYSSLLSQAINLSVYVFVHCSDAN